MEIYEVLLANGERIGCTSNPLEYGDEIKFPSHDGVTFVVNEFDPDKKIYYVVPRY